MIFAGIGSLVVTLLRYFETTLDVGDNLSKAFKIIPNYCLTESIYIKNELENLILLRLETKPVSEDIYANENIGGSIIALISHFFIGLFLLFILEYFLINFLDKIKGKIKTRKVNREVD